MQPMAHLVEESQGVVKGEEARLPLAALCKVVVVDDDRHLVGALRSAGDANLGRKGVAVFARGSSSEEWQEVEEFAAARGGGCSSSRRRLQQQQEEVAAAAAAGGGCSMRRRK